MIELIYGQEPLGRLLITLEIELSPRFQSFQGSAVQHTTDSNLESKAILTVTIVHCSV